jgi:hypothetical protein
VAPLQLGGLRGKQSTPSIGWEVPVRSRRSTSGSVMEHGNDTEHTDILRGKRIGNGMLFYLVE